MIKRYSAEIDYGGAENQLTSIFLRSAPRTGRERLVQEALQIPGVVNVRTAMTGREIDHPGKDFVSLSGDAEMTDLRLPEEAPVVGMSIREAADRGILTDDVLVVAIERDGSTLTPKGDIEFRESDIIILTFRQGVSETVIDDFGGDIVHR